jgi:hypothetical protein
MPLHQYALPCAEELSAPPTKRFTLSGWTFLKHCLFRPRRRYISVSCNFLHTTNKFHEGSTVLNIGRSTTSLWRLCDGMGSTALEEQGNFSVLDAKTQVRLLGPNQEEHTIVDTMGRSGTVRYDFSHRHTASILWVASES